MTRRHLILRNTDIASLLAAESETVRQPLEKAYRRAARSSFLWPEEAYELVHSHRSRTELSGIGPFLEKRIRSWIEDPPILPPVPPIRPGVMAMPEAQAALAKKPHWLTGLRGDLQMHSEWSDGSGSIPEMADAVLRRNYEYISITDHSKGLKIAGSIDEEQKSREWRHFLRRQIWKKVLVWLIFQPPRT